MTQTKDGYLWLASLKGLFRFDGVTFEHYAPQIGPALPADRAFSLLSLPNGDLWVGFAGVISLLKNGQARNYTTRDGVPNSNAHSLVRDREGTIWVGTDDGLARLEGDRWNEVGKEWNFTGKSAMALLVDSKGTLWVATGNTIVFLPQGSRIFQPTSIRVGDVTQLVEAPNGKLWMAETSRSVRPIPLGARLPPSDTAEIAVGSQGILFARAGDLWVTTGGDGIRRAPAPELLRGKSGKLSSAVESFTTKDGLGDNYGLSVFQDYEGNIWIGTLSGLERFRMGGLVPVTLPVSNPNPVLAPDNSGDMWAFLGERIFHIGKSSVDEIKDPGDPAILTTYIAAYQEPSRVMWLISAEPALVRLENGYFSRFPAPKELPKPFVNYLGIAEDRSGVLWMAVDHQGLFRREKGTWSHFDVPTELSKSSVTAASTDGLGRPWFGYADGSIISMDGGKIRTLATRQNSPVRGVGVIRARNKHVWVGGYSRLAFFDGDKFHIVVPADRLSFEGVFGIQELADGSLWLCEKHGVIHINAPEVRKFLESPSYRVHYEVFDSRDGLPGKFEGSRNYGTVVEGTDGRIWFGADHGIAWLNPATIPASIPLPISIRSVATAGKQFAIQPNLTFPPQTENLQVGYTAVNLSVPERIRYRYKLDGVDKDWQDAGVRREAFYTNLGPGKYRFHMNARNEGGEWNPEEAVLDFRIAPAWFQTIWFRAFCVCVFLFLLWLLYQLRLKQLEAQFNITIDARVGERTRIARELHDTLLQTLHGLMFQFQAVRNLMPGRPEEAMRSLDEAIHETEKALAESRDAIQGLRSEPIAKGNLAELLQATSQELATTGTANQEPPVFDFIEEGERRTLSPTIKNEVCRIALEILRNAYRHAQAHRIEAEVRYGDDIFRLRIRDDGRGIDPKVLQEGGIAGHWGLRGVRERAERIGAQLDFWSVAGAGTEVQLTVPTTVAYEVSRNGVGSRLFRKIGNRG